MKSNQNRQNILNGANCFFLDAVFFEKTSLSALKLKGKKLEITEELSERLKFLADKYETQEFLEKDPSKYMHMQCDEKEAEIVALISSTMAFGRRDQILHHIDMILDEMHGEKPSEWIMGRKYKNYFTEGKKSFYRIFTHDDFILFFDSIYDFLAESSTIGNHLKKILKEKPIDMQFCTQISSLFKKNCKLMPHSSSSACKRINLYLKWMVRDKSPVDLGLWSSWYSKKSLLIPLDTHVMHQATELNLLERTKTGKAKSASMKTDLELTSKARLVFPEDPAKLDYALFGLGVTSTRQLKSP